jgi:UDPglucose 6-dehydrogenase
MATVARIAVVGTGYVGLSSGACFAHIGHSVTCIDIDLQKIEDLCQGQIPIVEPGLDKLVEEGLKSQRLKFSGSYSDSIPGAEFVFLCVPTPEAADGSADLSYIQQAARALSPLLDSGAVVVNKSTVPVGSTRVVERELNRPDVSVVSNPEFLREGSAIHDFLNPDRIVVGSEKREAATAVASLYELVSAPTLITDPASAETIKYAANAFLATKISYVNAIAAICEGVGADIQDVVLGIGYDKRIGHEFLRPGPGWGGSCFPKDTKALVRIAEDAGYEFGLLSGVIAVNEQQLQRIVAKIESLVSGGLKNGRIAVWGLTFKANTDDLRDSPAVEIVSRLLTTGATITVYDPTVTKLPALLEAAQLASDAEVAVAGADLLVLLTEWDEFKLINPELIREKMRSARVLDARNHLDRTIWMSAGFEYRGVGR